jgi:hypothetical protein
MREDDTDGNGDGDHRDGRGERSPTTQHPDHLPSV